MKYIVVSLLLISFANFCYSETQLSTPEVLLLPKKIWQNEGDGKDQYLTHWNEGETFASLGMGHFIWYPANISYRPYRESFTRL